MPITPIATDSAAELHQIVGDDSTATFEDDPKFVDSDPTGTASSENLEVQRDTDDLEDSEEEDEEADDDLDDDDLEDEGDEEVDDDLAAEEEDEEDDEEDDVAAAAKLQASGLTSVRSHSASAGADDDDDDAGDVDPGVDEDEIYADDLYADRIVDTTLRMAAMMAVTSELAASL
jgi:hypothetical protein